MSSLSRYYTISSLPASPAQYGTITAKGIEVMTTIAHGLRNSKGQQVYFSYQQGSAYGGNSAADAETKWDTTTDAWTLLQSSLGAEWVE